MARAGRHYHHGRMVEAAEAYAEAARTAERRVDLDEALYRQAKALERSAGSCLPDSPPAECSLESLRGAVRVLDEVARRRPDSRRTVRALFDASLLRIRLGDRRAGFAGLRAILVQYPESGQAGRSLQLVLGGLTADAALGLVRRLYGRVGETDLGDDLLDAEADLLDARGDRAGARAALLRMVREHPYPTGQRWDDALWRLADMAEEADDTQQAIDYLERMLSVHEWTGTPGSYTLPRFPHARLRIARLERDRGHLEAAEVSFMAVYDDFPTALVRDDALLELGEMLLAGGQHERACTLLRQVVDEFEVGRARRRAAEGLDASCAQR